MRTAILIAIFASAAALAQSSIVRVDAPLNTVAFDSFEEYENTLYQVLSVLDGAATYSATDGAVTASAARVFNEGEDLPLSLGNYGAASARSGVQYAGVGVNDTKTLSLTFTDPVFGFGGYYQFGDLNHLRTRFYDEFGGEINPGGAEYTERSNGDRFFLGWYSNTSLIKTIQFTGDYDPEAEVFGNVHAIDDIMIFDSVPEPGTMLALGLGLATVLRRRRR